MSDTKNVLLVGGAGYIGSHVAVALLSKGHRVTILDDFSNSSPSVIDRIKQVTNRSLVCVEGDMCDRAILNGLFTENTFDSVILLGGLKSVPESVADPVTYYDVNVGGAVALLDAMKRHECREIVFSSSATVYGDPDYLPYDEAHPVRPTNPYGMTKAMIENMILSVANSDPAFKAMILRYFNPVGAHNSALIGEDPKGEPNNLFPRIAEAHQKGKAITVFGSDFDTRDGTGMRDYIHVEDLANGHVRACEVMNEDDIKSVTTINLGTGTAYSVREVIAAWGKAVGEPIKAVVKPRRAGDIAAFWADSAKAFEVLGWKADRSLQDMCDSHWRASQYLQSLEGGAD